MKNLREAREQGKLEEFIAEREAEATGDLDAFNRAVTSMAQTSKEAPASLRKRNRAG